MANQLILDRGLDANGYVAPGAKATIYAAGTSTLITVYSDEAGTVTAANPIVADGNGFWPQRYVTANAKAVVTDADSVALYTLDPAPVTQSTGSAASLIPFTPSVAVPESNVQDAIDYVATSVASGYAAFGLGITGNATLLANLDATNIGAGVYRFDGTTTGTYPTGVAAADTGLVEHWRQAGATAMQFLFHATTDRVFHRRMASTAWGTWREVMTVNQALAEGDTFYRGPSSIARLAKGTAGQILQMNSGATAPEWASNTGTAVGLLTTTGATTVGPWALPAGVKRFTVTSNLSSLSGTGDIIIQLRVGGSFVTSGYSSRSIVGSSGNRSSTAGMIVSLGNAALFWDGAMDFWLHNPATNLWLCRHTGDGDTSAASSIRGTGSIALAGAVDGIQINSTAGTFDVSSFNVFW